MHAYLHSLKKSALYRDRFHDLKRVTKDREEQKKLMMELLSKRGMENGDGL